EPLSLLAGRDGAADECSRLLGKAGSHHLPALGCGTPVEARGGRDGMLEAELSVIGETQERRGQGCVRLVEALRRTPRRRRAEMAGELVGMMISDHLPATDRFGRVTAALGGPGPLDPQAGLVRKERDGGAEH